jgi:mannose-6-phosphate isomerase-like protein (cupin superfamily)
VKGFAENIEELTRANDKYRRVLYTGNFSQLVLMSLKPDEEIGLETHADNDQFFRIETGQGKVVIDDNEYVVEDGSAVLVPAGAKHNVINTSDTEKLKLYTIYSPPHHKDGIEFDKLAPAEASEEEFDGQTTE